MYQSSHNNNNHTYYYNNNTTASYPNQNTYNITQLTTASAPSSHPPSNVPPNPPPSTPADSSSSLSLRHLFSSCRACEPLSNLENSKMILNHMAQKHWKITPVFDATSRGLDHNKQWMVTASVPLPSNAILYGYGEHPVKKTAEKVAALDAIIQLIDIGLMRCSVDITTGMAGAKLGKSSSMSNHPSSTTQHPSSINDHRGSKRIIDHSQPQPIAPSQRYITTAQWYSDQPLVHLTRALLALGHQALPPFREWIDSFSNQNFCSLTLPPLSMSMGNQGKMKSDDVISGLDGAPANTSTAASSTASPVALGRGLAKKDAHRHCVMEACRILETYNLLSPTTHPSSTPSSSSFTHPLDPKSILNSYFQSYFYSKAPFVTTDESSRLIPLFQSCITVPPPPSIQRPPIVVISTGSNKKDSQYAAALQAVQQMIEAGWVSSSGGVQGRQSSNGRDGGPMEPGGILAIPHQKCGFPCTKSHSLRVPPHRVFVSASSVARIKQLCQPSTTAHWACEENDVFDMRHKGDINHVGDSLHGLSAHELSTPKPPPDTVTVINHAKNESIAEKWAQAVDLVNAQVSERQHQASVSLQQHYENFQQSILNQTAPGSICQIYQKRQSLPAYQHRSVIIDAIRVNQVVIVAGETGCGKSTQVPQYILEDMIEQGYGAYGNIIVTQPRRLSAISVASRVADERGEHLGDSVGYVIRMESCPPKRNGGTITFLTPGILLRRMIDEMELSSTTHIVIDEVHEQDLFTDFVLVLLRNLLPRRPNVRLVLMSATVNTDLLSRYFGHAPVVTIPVSCHPVSQLFLEDIFELLSTADTEARGRLDWLGSGNDSQPSSFGGGGGGGGNKRQRLAIAAPASHRVGSVVSSSLASQTTYRRSTVERVQQLEETEEIPFTLVHDLLLCLCQGGGDGSGSANTLHLSCVKQLFQSGSPPISHGSILIFMSGWDEISALCEYLQRSSEFRQSNRYTILPLHSTLRSDEQARVFDRSSPGCRKIIIATNIAETSITIDDVVYVIDSGRVKNLNHDPLSNISSLKVEWIASANARQRLGRVGRVMQGVCLRLYSRARSQTFATFPTPEMQRSPLEAVCLQAIALGVTSVPEFLGNAMLPPSGTAVMAAMQLLYCLEAIDDTQRLTTLGRCLARLPVDPRIGKLVLLGAFFGCFDPIVTIATFLTVRDPFFQSLEKREEAREAARQLCGGIASDMQVLLMAFRGWEKARFEGGSRGESEFCDRYCLSGATLKYANDVKSQLISLLMNEGYIAKDIHRSYLENSIDQRNIYSSNTSLIHAVLCAGLYPNLLYSTLPLPNEPFSKPKFRRQSSCKDVLHPKCVANEIPCVETPMHVYVDSIQSTQLFMRNTAPVPTLSVIVFASKVEVIAPITPTPWNPGYGNQSTPSPTLLIDGWIPLTFSDGQALEAVLLLRSSLQAWMAQRCAKPLAADSDTDKELLKLFSIITKSEMTRDSELLNEMKDKNTIDASYSNVSPVSSRPSSSLDGKVNITPPAFDSKGQGEDSGRQPTNTMSRNAPSPMWQPSVFRNRSNSNSSSRNSSSGHRERELDWESLRR